MSDLLHAAASDQLDALARRQVGAVELLDAYLGRIDERNAPLRAVVTLDPEGASETARRADATRANGRLLGPLHGLPITVADTFATAGLRTTAGAAELADHVPDTDAVVVARLRRAGAVLVGKTNVPAWAGDLDTANGLFGATANPWEEARSAGGSSGGSAAAVAAGLTSFDVGSDHGGSMRQPAAYCGVVGHLPTSGIVPVLGHLPPRPGELAPVDLAAAGPLARAAADLERILTVLAGPLPEDEAAWRLALPAARHEELASFRVAVWFAEDTDPVDDTVRAVLDEVVAGLRTDGATVTVPAPADRPVTLAASARIHRALTQSALPAHLPDEVRQAWLPSDVHDTEPALAWRAAHEARYQARARWAAFFADHDVVLLPVTPTVAPMRDERPPSARTITINGAERPGVAALRWSLPATTAGLPATVVPVGLAGGLPVGLQVVGPRYGDRTTLALARHLERLTGGYQRPPGW